MLLYRVLRGRSWAERRRPALTPQRALHLSPGRPAAAQVAPRRELIERYAAQIDLEELDI